MFLQTSLTNRRQFLERSMLGFGSAFLLPSLLTGCTDHIIPDPDTPIIFPPLNDYEIDWNEKAKILVKTGLELIPEVGEILGPLAELFWPASKVDVWGQVKAQTEAIVDKKIADSVYQQVSQHLEGLNNSIVLYQQTRKSYYDSVTKYAIDPINNSKPNPTDLRIQWIATKNLFVFALPDFQSNGVAGDFRVPLLGLFVQFANMYLSLLRDMVISGKEWGRTDGDQQQDVISLKTAITAFTTYTTDTYNNGRFDVLKKINQSNLNEPFKTINTYDRQMTLTILHYMDTWPYYDVTQYPNGANVVLTREIYSDPMGNYKYGNPASLYIQPILPTQPPTQLSLWGGSGSHTDGVLVTAVQVTYPAGSGPGGVTQTPRMGAQNTTNDMVEYSDQVSLSPDNPVIAVQCTYSESFVHSFQLTFNDGKMTKVIGGTGNPNPTKTVTWTFPNTLMSSILITGASTFNGQQSAACIVFGFQDWTPPKATLRAISSIYVTSPKEHSAADFAKAFPKLGIAANSITEALKAARQAYWAYVKARAKELK